MDSGRNENLNLPPSAKGYLKGDMIQMKRISSSIPNLTYTAPFAEQKDFNPPLTKTVVSAKSIFKTRKSISQKINLDWSTNTNVSVKSSRSNQQQKTIVSDDEGTIHQHIKTKVVEFFRKLHVKSENEVPENDHITYKSNALFKGIETVGCLTGCGRGQNPAGEALCPIISKEKHFPQINDVLSWGNSFQALLNHPYGVGLFKMFLKTEYSEENLEFWLACEKYRTLPENKREVTAKDIYVNYLRLGAPKQVNLDTATRSKTISGIEHLNEHTFDLAQKRIYSLMERDSYNRFIASELYKNLLPKELNVSKQQQPQQPLHEEEKE